LLLGGNIDPLVLPGDINPAAILPEPTTSAPETPEPPQQQVVELPVLTSMPGAEIPIPELVGQKPNQDKFWTTQNIAIAAIIVAGLAGVGYYLYKKYRGGNANGNNSGFNDFGGGDFGGDIGDFSDFGPPSSQSL
jgi:hypothetical protein